MVASMELALVEGSEAPPSMCNKVRSGNERQIT